VPATLSFFTDGKIHISVYNIQEVGYKREGYTVNLKFRLPSGNYIIPLNSADKSNGVTLGVVDGSSVYNGSVYKCAPVTVTPLHSGTTDNKVCYYDMVIPETNSKGTFYCITVKVMVDRETYDKGLNTEDVILLPIFKYEDNMYVEDGVNVERYISNYALPSSSRVKRKVMELDKNGVFNYTHIVSKEELIENPLDPRTFLYTNHPYNSFTICQMSTYDSDISVTNKIRG
jgi:hypothetical protein